MAFEKGPKSQSVIDMKTYPFWVSTAKEDPNLRTDHPLQVGNQSRPRQQFVKWQIIVRILKDKHEKYTPINYD